MKRSLLLFSIAAATAMAAAPAPDQIRPSTVKKVKETFNGETGWWWYEEEVKNPETNETKVIRYKLSPAAKKQIEEQKDQTKLMQELLKELKQQRKINELILERLEYAFPNTTPKYTVNKKTGEKCLTNSSMDCFVMPVIAEGQHVPVLKNFLRNPSPENSKKWLQWQATYFNHLNKVSNGLRFAYLAGGEDAYPTTTTYTYGDNLFAATSENAQKLRQLDVIKGLKDNLMLMVYVGDTALLDKTSGTFLDMYTLVRDFKNQLKIAYIFPSKDVLDQMERDAKDYFKTKHDPDVWHAWQKAKKVVRPDIFKARKIRVTPTVMAYYKTKEMQKPLIQTIYVGSADATSIRRALINFLKYNGVITAKENSADRNWNVLNTDAINPQLRETPKAKAPVPFEKGDPTVDLDKKETPSEEAK